MAEHAIAIARVSSGTQAEEDQEPGLRGYSDRKGYILDAVIRVHGKSAFHGTQVKYILAAVDEHVRNGSATVVIFRHVDRSSRQGVFEGFDLLKKIMDAGARVEFSEQEYLSQQPGMIGMFFDMAQKESEIKRDRKLQGNVKKRANGQLIGGIPWGYDPVFANDVRINITPNTLGREWIPRIYAAAIDGKSLRAICEMLKGVPSPRGNRLWDEATVKRIIGRTTHYGQMPSNPFMKFESLISVEVWKQANLAVKSRSKRGRGTVKLEPALVRPYCHACWRAKREGAPSGMSPMYRTSAGTGTGHFYYSCKGHGPARCSCGAPGIPQAALDKAIDEKLSNDTHHRMVREYVAGDDSADRRAVINEKIRAAQEANDYLLVAQLAQEAMEIGPSIRKGSIELVDSGQNFGDYWQTLPLAEKRDELTNWNVIAGLKNGQVYATLYVENADRYDVLSIGEIPSEIRERYEMMGLD